ncbi:hypothetical protein BRC81_09965 [Halobacteriales archaeon QS_1_68_20]|nr:MAG: hypothetical protein BRC81_09965 [Halobacteriales archaeon QS_1_68_20]
MWPLLNRATRPNRFGGSLSGVAVERSDMSEVLDDPWMRDVAKMMVGWLTATTIAIALLLTLGPALF